VKRLAASWAAWWVLAWLSAISTADAAQRVFVAGGSGRSGIEIVRVLRANGYDVIASTRDIARARQRFGSDIHWVQADMHDVPAVMAAVAGADYVVSALGHGDFSGVEAPQFTMYLAVRNLVDAAKAAGAKQVVIMTSATAGHRFDHRLEARYGYLLYWMTKAEDYLLASGLPYTILGPGGLVEPGAHASLLSPHDKAGVRDANQPPAEDWGVRIIPRSEYKLDWVSRRGVATVVLAALRDPAARGKAVAVVWDRDGGRAALRGGFAAIAAEPATTDSYLTKAPPIPRRPGPVQLAR